jgi:hypothetical protein
LLDPPSASSVGDAVTEASGPFVDDVHLNPYARTHQTAGQSDGVDSEDAFEGAANSVNHETDGFRNGEDIATRGDADPREGIVSNWDILDEEFIVEAEELGKSEHSLLHTP